MYDSGDYAVQQIAAEFGVTRPTIYGPERGPGGLPGPADRDAAPPGARPGPTVHRRGRAGSARRSGRRRCAPSRS